MKIPLIAALLLASVQAQAQTDISTIPTLKLTESLLPGAIPGGVSTQFYGEVHIPEPFVYYGIQNGFTSVDYSIGWGFDTAAELRGHLSIGLRLIDLLSPVNEGRASVSQVWPGYCAILAGGRHFGGRWSVRGPGVANLSRYLFDDAARSVAVYKMLGSGCKPEEDIPMLLDANRRMYPLVVGKGNRDNAIHREPLQRDSVYVASRFAEQYQQTRIGTGYMVYLGGGFSAAAQTLTVPQCYSVTLQYRTSATEYGEGSAHFQPGTHTLAHHGIARVLSASVQRSPGCTQPPRPAPLVVAAMDQCIHPSGGSPTPGNNTPAVYHAGCLSEPRLSFSFTAGGSLRQQSSGMCLHPLGGSATPAPNTPVVYHAGCDEPRLRFELTDSGLLRHVSSGMCVVPEGTSFAVMPANGTRAVLAACPPTSGPHLFFSRLNGTLPYSLNAEGRDGSGGAPTYVK